MHLIERKPVKNIGGAKTTQAEGKILSVKRGKLKIPTPKCK